MASDALSLNPVNDPQPQAARRSGVYGAPPAELAAAPAEAIQFSPLVPGAAALESEAPHALAAVTMLAPPGTLERRYALALALGALAPGAPLAVLAPKDKGGSRIGEELRGFGCDVEESSKRHHRICVCARPGALPGLDEALTAGAPQWVEALGLWSQPGVFSWNRLDPGSALLIEQMPALAGRGADIGCGFGALALAALSSPQVSEIGLIDIDRRAIEAARRNVRDARAHFYWADARQQGADLGELDFVVMNPPFHDGGAEDQGLGKALIQSAAKMLRKGGALWLVANRRLPYEAALKPLFRQVAPRIEAEGYKVFEARK